jgi:HEAT repeat protein
LIRERAGVSGLHRTVIAAVGIATICSTAIAQNPRGWDYPMFRDPLLPKIGLKLTLATRADIGLWQQVLSRANPMMDTQLCAIINRQQKAGLHLPPALFKQLTQLALGRWNAPKTPSESQINSWRTAQIAALQVVGTSLAAHDLPALIRLDRSGSPALVLAVDPILYGHRSGAMLTIWRRRAANERLSEPLRQSAVAGLQKDHDHTAQAMLLKLCFGPQIPVRLRIAAANALASLHFRGAIPTSKGLGNGIEAGHIYRILVAMVTAGSGIPAPTIKLCSNPNPMVELIALRAVEKRTALCRSLINSDGGRSAAALADAHLPSIRHAMTRIALQAGISGSLPLLFSQLSDPRGYISDDALAAITQLAQIPSLRQQVVSDAMKVVDSTTTKNHAQAQMQSLLILGRLRVTAAVAPAARLLHSHSDRVVLASVILLRRLKAAGETGSIYHLAVKILNHEFELRKQFMRKMAKQHVSGAALASPQYAISLTGRVLLQSQTLAQAFCMLGQMKYRPAIPSLVRLIPQFGPYATRSREAAIWAIGKIDSGHPNAAIARQLLSRLNDAYNLPPEIDGVRAMAAIALARMGYKPALGSIKTFAVSVGVGRSTLACIWAARKLAGKIYPLPTNHKIIPRGFIQPYPH